MRDFLTKDLPKEACAMSFYSYKNANSTRCPCSVSGNDVLNGLNEKVCEAYTFLVNNYGPGDEM